MTGEKELHYENFHETNHIKEEYLNTQSFMLNKNFDLSLMYDSSCDLK